VWMSGVSACFVGFDLNVSQVFHALVLDRQIYRV
jgi:hypothetical protein